MRITGLPVVGNDKFWAAFECGVVAFCCCCRHLGFDDLRPRLPPGADAATCRIFFWLLPPVAPPSGATLRRHPPAPPSGATLRSQWKWPTDAGDATHRRQQQPLSTIIDSDVAWRGPPLGGARKEGAASLLLISSLKGPPHSNHKESQRIRRESFKNEQKSLKNPSKMIPIREKSFKILKYLENIKGSCTKNPRNAEESFKNPLNNQRILQGSSKIPQLSLGMEKSFINPVRILQKSSQSLKNPSKIFNNLENLKESYKKMKESQKNPSKVLEIS